MLRRTDELFGYHIAARDGDIGKVSDLYFDDNAWVVRYFVVSTGGVFGERMVLIAPHTVERAEPERRALAVGLTREQVEKCPDIDTAKPVSRQEEIEYRQYFGWPPYGGGMFGATGFGLNPEMEAVQEQMEADRDRARREGDPHLRSVHGVCGYHIVASDGEIGHVQDFIVDDDTWALRYAIVDTRNWLPGKKVLVAPEWIETIDWFKSDVTVDLTRERIKRAPEFDESRPLDRAYQERLRSYYHAA